MASYDHGKDEVVKWLKKRFPKGATALDVGACDGKWAGLLGDHFKMDGVEIWEAYIIANHLKEKYNKLFHCDIADLEYEWYDLIIFGDVLEHMTVEQAQKVLAYAKPRCKDILICVPFLFSQGELFGNKYEIHIQNDLTPEIFEQRYPGFEMLLRPIWEIGIYHKKGVE